MLGQLYGFSTRLSCFGVLFKCVISSSSYCLGIVSKTHVVPAAKHRCEKGGNYVVLELFYIINKHLLYPAHISTAVIENGKEKYVI